MNNRVSEVKIAAKTSDVLAQLDVVAATCAKTSEVCASFTSDPSRAINPFFKLTQKVKVQS